MAIAYRIAVPFTTTKRQMTMNSNLTDALANLNYRILNSQAEFPDACWNAASQYNVPYEELADAYDRDTELQADRRAVAFFNWGR